MEKKLSLIVICMSLSLSLSFSKELTWVTDFAEGLKLAAKEEKSMMVDFYTDWCRWCKVLDTVTYVDANVIKFSGNLVCVKANAEEDTLAAKNYMVHGYPSILFLDKDGQEIDRIVGYLPADEFLKAASDILEDKNTFTALQKKEKEHPKDIDLLYELAEKYTERGMYDEAKARFEKIMKIDPKNESGKADSSMFNIGYLTYRTKKLGDKRHNMAINEFNKFIATFPKSNCVEDAQFYIGYCYEKAADTTAAVDAYQKFISDYPDSESCDWVKKRIETLKSKETEQE